MQNKNNHISNWLYSNHKTVGFLAFLFVLSFVGFVVSLRYKMIQENQDKEMVNILNIIEGNCQQILKSSYVATLTLAMTINDKGVTENFDEVAAKLINAKSGIDAVQLVPNGIITNVYPLEPNKAVLKYNILKSPYNIKKEAEKSIERKEIYFAGPLKLIQGGVGVVGRLPVFKNNKFWGFSAVVIKLETLVKSCGLESFDKKKYLFQLSKYNSITNKEEFFLENKIDFSDKYYKTVTIPDGDWKIYVISKKDNVAFFQVLTSSILGLLLAIVTGILISYLLRRPAELQEILQRKSKKLLISEREYKALFDQAPIGIAKLDNITGEYLEINSQYCSIIGYTEEEIKKLDLNKCVHPEDLEFFLSEMERLKNDEISEFSMEKRVYNKDGKLILVNLHVASIWKNDDKIKTHIRIIEDITNKKIAEDNLKESFEIVSEQNKRLLNFSYIISHNLRSHTSNIQTIADLLENTGDENEKTEMIDLLKKVSKSLNETMYNLNEVVNIRTNVNLSIEWLNLHFYTENTILILNERVSEKNLKIINNVPLNAEVKCNVAYLESILYNFISNAIRYSHHQRKSEVTISFNMETNTLKISDTGIGIDLNKNGDELFGLYKTFSNNTDGKGVGLYIAKNQIDAIGATVTVESELNVGTTFSIHFK